MLDTQNYQNYQKNRSKDKRRFLTNTKCCTLNSTTGFNFVHLPHSFQIPIATMSYNNNNDIKEKMINHPLLAYLLRALNDVKGGYYH